MGGRIFKMRQRVSSNKIKLRERGGVSSEVNDSRTRASFVRGIIGSGSSS